MAPMPKYSDLVKQVGDLTSQLDTLQNKLNEQERYNVAIKRDATTTAPTSLDTGMMLLSDDGSNQRIYWQSPSGLVYFDGTAA